MCLTKSITDLIDRMDSVTLKPSLSAGISICDKKSGTFRCPECVRITFTTTLLRMILFLVGGMILLKSIFCLCRFANGQKMKKKMMKKLRGRMKKMSKS